jgi:hypothetical protein
MNKLLSKEISLIDENGKKFKFKNYKHLKETLPDRPISTIQTNNNQINIDFLNNLTHDVNIFGYTIPFADFNKKIAIDILLFSERCERKINDKKYNLTQLETFENNGWRLIQVFEDELITKPDIVLSRIKHILGLSEIKIYARNCEVIQIDSKKTRQFLSETHIQGPGNSCVNSFGLIHNNKIISIMTFSKPRYNKNIDWEILRYSTINNVNLIGGASKIFSHFVKTFNPKKIISYADRRYSNGKLYENLGFKLKEKSFPCYWYFKTPDKKYHRSTFQKHKLKRLLEIFDENKTELENMKINNWDRIFDSGNYVYLYEK